MAVLGLRPGLLCLGYAAGSSLGQTTPGTLLISTCMRVFGGTFFLKHFSFTSSLSLAHTIIISNAVSIQGISRYSMSHPCCSLPLTQPLIPPPTPPQPPSTGRCTHTPEPFFFLSLRTTSGSFLSLLVLQFLVFNTQLA